MILYLDSSSLVKRYVLEPGSDDVGEAVQRADLVGTAVISRAEVAAALGRAVRVGALTREDGWSCLQALREDWPGLVLIQVSDLLCSHAEALAWEHGLRGYDAVQLAAASLWQEMMGERVALSTFDQRLWDVARGLGLLVHPQDLPELVATWKGQD